MIFFLLVMDVILKNKFIYFRDYKAKCAIGKRGITSKKVEGDKCTPRGRFKFKYIFFRRERVKNIDSKLKVIPIKKNFGWCDDVNFPSHYNKKIIVNNKIRHEKLHRDDNKNDLLIPIKYNFDKPKVPNGSCIFLHLTNDYKPTEGCIALSKTDFLILLKLIKSNTKILIN